MQNQLQRECEACSCRVRLVTYLIEGPHGNLGPLRRDRQLSDSRDGPVEAQARGVEDDRTRAGGVLSPQGLDRRGRGGERERERARNQPREN